MVARVIQRVMARRRRTAGAVVVRWEPQFVPNGSNEAKAAATCRRRTCSRVADRAIRAPRRGIPDRPRPRIRRRPVLLLLLMLGRLQLGHALLRRNERPLELPHPRLVVRLDLRQVRLDESALRNVVTCAAASVVLLRSMGRRVLAGTAADRKRLVVLVAHLPTVVGVRRVA